MVSVRFIRTRWKNGGETKLERKRKEREARRKRLRIVVEGTRPILSDKLCIGWPPAPLAGFLDQTEITFSDETWRVGENARKEQDQGQKERERLRFHDRIWQRSIISKLWSKLWTLHALCFVFELPGSIKWEEMERQVGIDDKPFSRFRSTLKEFLNGQITAERISSDTFERTRSNWKPAVWKFLSRRWRWLGGRTSASQVRFNSV